MAILSKAASGALNVIVKTLSDCLTQKLVVVCVLKTYLNPYFPDKTMRKSEDLVVRIE